MPKSTLQYVLLGLIPYTQANLKLAFQPGKFFADLEKIDRIKRTNARNAYYRALKDGLFELDASNAPRLTEAGLRKVELFIAKKISRQGKLMIIFDIPETEAWKRQRLRLLLKELHFEQVQKSVWQSEYDYRETLIAEVKRHKLGKHVQIYESARLFP